MKLKCAYIEGMLHYFVYCLSQWMSLVRFMRFLKSENLIGNVVKREGCLVDVTPQTCTLIQSKPLRTNKNKGNK